MNVDEENFINKFPGIKKARLCRALTDAPRDSLTIIDFRTAKLQKIFEICNSQGVFFEKLFSFDQHS